jgi:hypothetical protein
MTDRSHPEDRAGLEKEPEDWVSGAEPMTGAQASYVETLARQAGENLDLGNLTKAGVGTDRRPAQEGRCRVA